MAQIMGKHWRSSGTSWAKFVWTATCRIVVGKTVRGSFITTFMGESTELGMYVRSSKNKGYFCQKMWMSSKWLETSRIWLSCGRNWWNMWILTNPHHFLMMKTWDALSVNANRMKQLSNKTIRCLNHVFLLGQRRNYQGGKNFTQKQSRVPMTWKD